MTHKTLRLTLPLVLLAAIACKKQDEPAATAGYQAGSTGGAGGPATGPQPSAAPTTTAVPSASAPIPAPTTPPPADPALVAAITPMLTQLGSSQVVAGSKPLGTALVGNVGGAQTLEQQIMLQPNKCYSVVAAGLPPITDVNVQLLAVTVIPGMAPVLAVDQDVGPSATLGKKPNCYKWAWPIAAPVKVVIAATGGQGLAAAQLFGK